MQSMITQITGKNQVTVPAALVKKLGMKPGTKLDWQLSEDNAVLTIRVIPNRADLAASLKGAGRSHLRPQSAPLDELQEARALEEEDVKDGDPL